MLHRINDSHGNLLNNERKMVTFAINIFEKYSIHGANHFKVIPFPEVIHFPLHFGSYSRTKSGNYSHNVRNSIELLEFLLN